MLIFRHSICHLDSHSLYCQYQTVNNNWWSLQFLYCSWKSGTKQYKMDLVLCVLTIKKYIFIYKQLQTFTRAPICTIISPVKRTTLISYSKKKHLLNHMVQHGTTTRVHCQGPAQGTTPKNQQRLFKASPVLSAREGGTHINVTFSTHAHTWGA